jgi:Fur family ferric uptake transcriptional regulator
MSIKPTKNQQQILNLLKEVEEEISAQQLHFQLHSIGSNIGLATVYRALKKLHHHGIIQERVTSTGESFYCLIENAHEHHLNCIHCGRSITIEDCPLEEELNQWCQSQKFSVYYHTLEFFGVCADCQEVS